MFKKISFILTGALALTMVAGCEREDLSNPNYDPETNSVVTNFVFNVSTATGKTKQSDAAVQASASNPFRGITDAKLLVYHLNDDNKILAADATASQLFDLAEVASAGSLSSTESRRVLEMSLPLTTNTMLFYGRAIPNSPASATDKDEYGHLDTYQISETAGSGLFTLGKRLKDTEKGKFYATEKLFAGILSVIMNTNLKDHPAISKDASPVGNANKYKFDIAANTYTNISWSSYNLTNSPVQTSHSPYPLEVKLANAYKQMTSINAAGGELRAGSGYAILRTIQDLWSVINGIRCAEPLNEPEAVAKYLANEIFIRIGKYFHADSTPGDGAAVTGVAFQTMSDIATAFQSAAEVAARPAVTGQSYQWPSDDELNSIASVVPADFPFNFNLPRGASHYSFNTTSKAFYYPSTFNTSGMGGAMEGGQFNAESYFYPAELLYFGNSPIRTSDSEHKVSEYPQGSGTGTGMWSNDGSWGSEWNGASVKLRPAALL